MHLSRRRAEGTRWALSDVPYDATSRISRHEFPEVLPQRGILTHDHSFIWGNHIGVLCDECMPPSSEGFFVRKSERFEKHAIRHL
mmetsp:Transcript_26234/g.38996  ORF Transcript_26234/g.38996 Transcript_26234/m.38996 type:complete len:85 (+) Transcript_26234:397-651(+)